MKKDQLARCVYAAEVGGLVGIMAPNILLAVFTTLFLILLTILVSEAFGE